VTIAVLCPHFEDTGGVREVVAQVARAHAAAGHRIVIVSRARSQTREPVPRFLPPGVEVWRVPVALAPHRGVGWREVRQFARRFAQGGWALAGRLHALAPDVVAAHCSKFHAPWVIAARLGSRAPVVVHLHNAERTADGPPSPFWSRRLLATADHVIAVSPAVAAYALATRPALAGRVSVVRNGIESRDVPAPAAETRPRPYLVAVGRLARQKGFDVLLDALARLPGPATLVIAGDGPERTALANQAQRLGLSKHVEFLGEVPHERVQALLRGAAAVVMPSRFEGNPLIALEAMRAGATLVASAIDGLPEELCHGVTGVLVPPDDAGALAAALAHLLADPVTSRRYGEAAARAARTMPTWTDVAARILAVYENVAHST